MQDFTTIFLTGATKGFGKLLAQEFHSDNYKVIGLDLIDRKSIPNEVSQLFTDYYTFDLSDNHKIGQFVEDLFSAHPEISVLINNAGILDFRFFEEYSDEEVLETISVNLVASILMTKSFYPQFIKAGRGRFINISSSSSFRGFETGCLYTPTKAGLNLFTESFRKELDILKKKTGEDITINNVCPGRIATDEFLADNPKVNPDSLVSHKFVYKKIKKLINSGKNGEVIPIFPGKLKLEILKKDISRFI